MRKLSKIIKIVTLCLFLFLGVTMMCRTEAEAKVKLTIGDRDDSDDTVTLYLSGVDNLNEDYYRVVIDYESEDINTGNTGPYSNVKKVKFKKSGSKYKYTWKLPKKGYIYIVEVDAYSHDEDIDDISTDSVEVRYADSKPQITIGDIEQRVLSGHTYKDWYDFLGTSTKDGNTYYYKGTSAQVGVVIQSESNLTSVVCKVGGTTVGTKTNVSTGAGGYKAVTFDISGEHDGTVSFTATNENGTVTKSTGKTIVIDNTKPEIEIENAYKKKQDTVYKNKTVSVTVTIKEKNFDSSATKIMVDNTAQSVSWSGSGDIKTAEVKISSEGEHVITVTSTDKAGNEADSVKSANIIIDKTSPTVTVSGVSNAKSYGSKNAKNIVVTIKDKYLAGSQSIKLTKSNGEEITENITEGVADKTYTWTISDVEEDGYYKLVISGKDKAGNKISKKKKSYKLKKGKVVIEFYINRNGSKYDIATESEEYFGNTLKSENMGDIVIYEYNVNRITRSAVSLITALGDTALSQGVNYTCETVTLEEAPKTDGDADYSNYQNVYKYTINKDNFSREGVYGIKIETEANVKGGTGNESLKVTSSNSINKTINIDNTSPEIISMVKSGSTIYVHVRDNNISSENISLTVSGKTVKLEEDSALPSTSTNYYYTAEAGSSSTVKLTCTDSAGNESVSEEVESVGEGTSIVLTIVIIVAIAVVIIAATVVIIVLVRRKK